MSTDIKEILKRSQLSVTASREKILNLFLEEAGASLLDFTNSGPVAGAAVVQSVAIPVIGGFGGGPWLDGRMRMVHAAIGYPASALDSTTENYANVARITLDAMTAYAEDVRAARQIKGAAPVKSKR